MMIKAMILMTIMKMSTIILARNLIPIKIGKLREDAND